MGYPYYAWHQRHQVPALEPAWQLAVHTAFQRHGRRYGTRRLRAELQAEGCVVGRTHIRRTLVAHGLRALTRYDPATALICAPHH